MPGRVLTVASGKGGVGKTTTAVNLAVALWREGNAVAVVDADLGMANLAAVLGIDPPATLHDVLAGQATLQEAVVEARDGDLVVVPGERDLTGFAAADPGELEAVLGELATDRDFVVVDTGAGLSYEDVLPLGLADEVLLVTTPDPAAVGDTHKTLELSGLLDVGVAGVVVTRVLDDSDPEAVAAEVGAALLGAIPEDPAVTESTAGAGPLESVAPDAPATLAYRELAARFAGGSPPEVGDAAAEAAEAATGDVGAEAETATGGAGATSNAPGADGGETPTAAEAEAVDGSDSGEPERRPADGEGAGAAGEEDDSRGPGDDEPEESGGDGPTAGEEEQAGGGQSTEADEEAGGNGEEEANGSAGRDEEAGGKGEEEAGGSAGPDEEAGENGEQQTDDPGRRGGFRGWLGRRFR